MDPSTAHRGWDAPKMQPLTSRVMLGGISSLTIVKEKMRKLGRKEKKIKRANVKIINCKHSCGGSGFSASFYPCTLSSQQPSVKLHCY